MFRRIRVTILATTAAGLLLTALASTAQAGVFSLTTGSCGLQESQPFAKWGDYNSYTLVPGGTFEPGSPSWTLTGGANVAAGNESYYVSGPGSYSMSLPAGSSATSPAACTGLDHPSVRFFVRNTGSPSSDLLVVATYPTVLGMVSAPVGVVSGSSTWEPSPPLSLWLTNIVGTLNLNESTISFSFIPTDSSGDWSIDDVYLDPFARG